MSCPAGDPVKWGVGDPVATPPVQDVGNPSLAIFYVEPLFLYLVCAKNGYPKKVWKIIRVPNTLQKATYQDSACTT